MGWRPFCYLQLDGRAANIFYFIIFVFDIASLGPYLAQKPSSSVKQDLTSIYLYLGGGIVVAELLLLVEVLVVTAWTRVLPLPLVEEVEVVGVVAGRGGEGMGCLELCTSFPYLSSWKQLEIERGIIILCWYCIALYQYESEELAPVGENLQVFFLLEWGHAGNLVPLT